MSFLASLLNFLSLPGTSDKACYLVWIDEPEAPKSIIER